MTSQNFTTLDEIWDSDLRQLMETYQRRFPHLTVQQVYDGITLLSRHDDEVLEILRKANRVEGPSEDPGKELGIQGEQMQGVQEKGATPSSETTTQQEVEGGDVRTVLLERLNGIKQSVEKFGDEVKEMGERLRGLAESFQAVVKELDDLSNLL
ncbi:hypothetical protein SLS60_009200 [Paraconiothyrium brasiliense]|uniref:Uncharacterized protein n=1 Tax=Paraconiothyrium brasiliense TaxID=300254 RepID=A0ABR3QWM5_9PLEO